MREREEKKRIQTSTKMSEKGDEREGNKRIQTGTKNVRVKTSKLS
jgi:hypothetical protein